MQLINLCHENNKREVKGTGWFADKYGKDTHPKMSIDTYDDLLTKYGEKYANEFLDDWYK